MADVLIYGTPPEDDGGSQITRFTAQWKSGAQNWSTGRQVRGATLPIRLGNLTRGVAYDIRVRPENAINPSPQWSNTVTVTPPTDRPAQRQAIIFFGTPPDGGSPILHFLVQWRRDDQNYSSVRQVQVAASPALIAGPLDLGERYWARVAAVSEISQGGWSPERDWVVGTFVEGPDVEGPDEPVPPLEGDPIPQPPLEGAPVTLPPGEGPDIPQDPREGAPIPVPPLEGAPIPQDPREGPDIPQPPREGAPIHRSPSEGSPRSRTPMKARQWKARISRFRQRKGRRLKARISPDTMNARMKRATAATLIPADHLAVVAQDQDFQPCQHVCHPAKARMLKARMCQHSAKARMLKGRILPAHLLKARISTTARGRGQISRCRRLRARRSRCRPARAGPLHSRRLRARTYRCRPARARREPGEYTKARTYRCRPSRAILSHSRRGKARRSKGHRFTKTQHYNHNRQHGGQHGIRTSQPISDQRLHIRGVEH